MSTDDKSLETAGERELRTQREIDAIDFHQELSGDPVRLRRFIPLEESASMRKQREAEANTKLFLSIASQQSVARFQERLNELDRASIIALNKAEEKVTAAESALEDIRARATRAPDGRLVYRTRDGKSAFYDDGTPLANPDSIDWKLNAPTWETNVESRDSWSSAVETRDRIATYRDNIHTAKERTSSGQPLTEDELRELEGGAEDMPPEVEAALREMKAPSVATPGASAQADAGLAGPKF